MSFSSYKFLVLPEWSFPGNWFARKHRYRFRQARISIEMLAITAVISWRIMSPRLTALTLAHLWRHHVHAIATPLPQRYFSITSPIFPARPPPLFPLIAIETALAQLDINRIMRLAHPLAKLVSAADPRLVAVFHPRPEIVGAHPARVHLSEQCDELPGLVLLRERGSFWVRCCQRVEKCPRGAAELFDVWWAV